MRVSHSSGTSSPNAAKVIEAERLLQSSGYDPGKIDGRRSQALARALTTYQRAAGLQPTGKLDEETLKSLRALRRTRSERSDRFVTLGMKGGEVRRIEARLEQLGYDVGKVDGVYTQSTYAAVKQFKQDHLKGGSDDGGMGLPAQALLAKKAGATVAGGKDQDANVRAVTFNWPRRYRTGGDAADEQLFDRLSAQADVMGLTEFFWHKRITDREKDWAFYNPDPRGDGVKDNAGQVLAWRKDTFSLVEKGTTLLNKKTRIQPEAAGQTLAQEKSIIWAKLRHKETGEVWTVAVVHFVPSKHLGGAALKLWKQQRDRVTSWMAKQGPRTLLMGDFNGQWPEAVSRPFHKVARAQTADSHGSRAIDWVLRSKDLKAKGGGRALHNRGQSDHRPVKAVVRG